MPAEGHTDTCEEAMRLAEEHAAILRQDTRLETSEAGGAWRSAT